MASRKNKPARDRRITENDLAILDTPTGREDVTGASDPGSLLAEELRSEDAPKFAREEFAPSEVAAPHEPGDDSQQTDDGLNQLEEAVRHLAEDIPTGDVREDKPRETPVFDRRLAGPKV